MYRKNPRSAQPLLLSDVNSLPSRRTLLEAEAVRAKTNAEIGAGCLQSLDDLEASYRKKGNRAYKGYVAHIAETCHPANPVQLIDQVQVAPKEMQVT